MPFTYRAKAETQKREAAAPRSYQDCQQSLDQDRSTPRRQMHFGAKIPSPPSKTMSFGSDSLKTVGKGVDSEMRQSLA